MSRTIPEIFVGKATITPEKLAFLTEEYLSNLRNMDVATDAFDNGYYSGASDAYKTAVTVLLDVSQPSVKKVVKTTKRFGFKKALIVVGVVIITIKVLDRLTQPEVINISA